MLSWILYRFYKKKRSVNKFKAFSFLKNTVSIGKSNFILDNLDSEYRGLKPWHFDNP